MAVTLTALELAQALDETVTDDQGTETATDTVTRILDVVRYQVDRYAPDAPAAVSNEAAIRYAAYLCATTQSSWFTSMDLSGIKTEFHPNHGLAFRNCGAQALLTRYVRRNAGVIG